MSIQHLLTQSLSLQAVGGSTLDAYGNALPGAQGTPVAVNGYLEQMSSVEFVNARQTTITQWHAYLPAGTAIHPSDFITYAGQRFQVDGEPWQVWNPRTAIVSHIRCKLTEVS